MEVSLSKVRKFYFVIPFIVLTLLGVFITPANASFTVKPKVGHCFNLSALEVSEPYPSSNPVACSKLHNAETFLVAKWPLSVPPEDLPEGEGLEIAASLCRASGNGSVLQGYKFTYWAWYTPDPKGWARGQRWLRCDAMIVRKDSNPMDFLSWRGLIFKGKKPVPNRT